MNSPAYDVAVILEAAGCGTVASTSGWSIYVGREDEKPDTYITVYDYPGGVPDPRWLVDNPHVQVRVRGKSNDYSTTYTKALVCRDALLGYCNQTVNDTQYVLIAALGDVGFLEYDDKGRPIFTCNYRIVRQPSSGTYRG